MKARSIGWFIILRANRWISRRWLCVNHWKRHRTNRDRLFHRSSQSIDTIRRSIWSKELTTVAYFSSKLNVSSLILARMFVHCTVSGSSAVGSAQFLLPFSPSTLNGLSKPVTWFERKSSWISPSSSRSSAFYYFPSKPVISSGSYATRCIDFLPRKHRRRLQISHRWIRNDWKRGNKTQIGLCSLFFIRKDKLLSR